MAKSTYNFKECVATADLLAAELQSQTFRPIYTLMGEESYFIDSLENKIVAAALSESQRDFNLSIVYGKDSAVNDIILACRRYPMMAERQVIVVREAQSLAKIEELEHYAKNPTLSTVLVLCHKNKSIDKRSALYKALDKNGQTFESIPPRDYELEAYIRSTLSERKVAADAKSVSMLAEFIGPNLAKLDNELSKMLALLPAQNPQLTPEIIEQNVGISKDYNIFELTKALSMRNFHRSLTIADHFGNNPKNYPFVVTMSMLFTHFQRIVITGLMLWEAKRCSQPTPNDAAIAKQLGVTPYFVSEYTAAIRNYPLPVAFAIIGLLREYDMKSKGIGGGMADDAQLLKELLLRISVQN